TIRATAASSAAAPAASRRTLSFHQRIRTPTRPVAPRAARSASRLSLLVHRPPRRGSTPGATSLRRGGFFSTGRLLPTGHFPTGNLLRRASSAVPPATARRPAHRPADSTDL